MRYIILFLLPFMAIFLQSTVFSYYSIKGSVPDMVLIFVTFFALHNGADKGGIYGLLCGMLEDLYTGRYIGINSLSKGLTSFIIGKFQGKVFKENILVGVISIIVATLLNALFIIIMARIFFPIFHIDMFTIISTIYQTIYNAIIGIPLYIWYYYSTRDGLLRESGENL